MTIRVKSIDTAVSANTSALPVLFPARVNVSLVFDGTGTVVYERLLPGGDFQLVASYTGSIETAEIEAEQGTEVRLVIVPTSGSILGRVSY